METKRGNQPTADNGKTAKDAKTPAPFSSGLQVNGEFRVGEKIILGVREGKVLIRQSPQGDEVEVSEVSVAAALIDAFFTDKK